MSLAGYVDLREDQELRSGTLAVRAFERNICSYSRSIPIADLAILSGSRSPTSARTWMNQRSLFGPLTFSSGVSSRRAENSYQAIS